MRSHADSGAVKAGRVEGPREETSLLSFLSIVLKHRRVIVTCALAGSAVFGLMAAARADDYVSRASFVVRGARGGAQLPGGAAMLGLTLSNAFEFSQSIVFYSELAKSTRVLLGAARKQYQTQDGSKKTLAEIYEIEAASPEAAARKAASRLFHGVSANIYSRSGVVGISVAAPDPLVAQQIATHILAELNAYSIQSRREQAIAERRFIEELVSDARARLTRSEEAVSSFLVLNREYENSPALRLEFNRLSREVGSRQEVYTALARELEQARIEEVRDRAPLNIVEPADLPADPETRDAIRKTLLGLAVGLLVGIVAAFLRQRAAESRAWATEGWQNLKARVAT